MQMPCAFLPAVSYLGTRGVQDAVVHHVLKGDGTQLLGDDAAALNTNLSTVPLCRSDISSR